MNPVWLHPSISRITPFVTLNTVIPHVMAGGPRLNEPPTDMQYSCIQTQTLSLHLLVECHSLGYQGLYHFPLWSLPCTLIVRRKVKFHHHIIPLTSTLYNHTCMHMHAYTYTHTHTCTYKPTYPPLPNPTHTYTRTHTHTHCTH